MVPGTLAAGDILEHASDLSPSPGLVESVVPNIMRLCWLSGGLGLQGCGRTVIRAEMIQFFLHSLNWKGTAAANSNKHKLLYNLQREKQQDINHHIKLLSETESIGLCTNICRSLQQATGNFCHIS
ncbi:hypothetical protein chiPu_0000110 [Chiloscyllium punctatum]|uniref:Uncharacterized protein n=1 Tax=Chiloscyllium punctatum TaxID=137246 RepID=A0A401RS17_CHIPU|nr:hypothetical protein [Chiloscyllium punctatum]